MINLLHLSDLHFGFDRDQTAMDQRAACLDLLVKELTNLTADWKPHVLVISGDLSWQGKPEGYTELAKWLRNKLLPATALKPADCIICPGNHDLDQKVAGSLLGQTQNSADPDRVLHPDRLDDGFVRPFVSFVKFATTFRIPAPHLRQKPNHLAGIRRLHGIQFVTLNTAWFCRDSKTDRGNLWLGLPQLKSLLPPDAEDYDQLPLTVAVLHHPPEWFAIAELNAYDNRPSTYEYLAARSHVILSGHTHGALKRPNRYIDRARLFIAGATYDNHQYRNNFSLLQIDPSARTITQRPWELDPRIPKWEEKKQETYSLRTEKSGRGSRNPGKYIAWLKDKTQTIDLNQLKAGPQDIPPPAIDVLYMKLMTAAPALKPEAPERPKPVALEQALQNRKLVIEGKPGSGKTTFVRWIAWMLCRPAGPPSGFPVEGFPLLVRINQLDQHIHNTLKKRATGDPSQQVEARWIPHFLASQGWDLDEVFFAEKMQEKNSVLLLDGLDEAANQPRRESMVQMIQMAAAQYECHLVVTTRPGADEGRATLDGFVKARIEELDDAGIDAFLLQWCRWLKRGDETAAQDYYKDLRPAVAVPAIHILARNPLMLTALAVLHLRRFRLPEQRAQLYEQIMEWLADQAVEKKPEQWRSGELLDRFGRLALGMQEWKGGQKLRIGIDTAAGLLARPGESIEPFRSFLEEAQINCGIVTLQDGEIAFWHRSFQEYLAARTLSMLTDADLAAHAKKVLYSPEGREVLPLLAGRMVESGKERLAELFEILTSDAAGQTTLKRKAHAMGVLGNMISDLTPAQTTPESPKSAGSESGLRDVPGSKAHATGMGNEFPGLTPNKYKLSGPAQTQFDRLSETVLAIFEKGKTRNIGLKTRVDAAEALDHASQSRLLLPGDPKYWVKIPGDTFTIGDPEAFQSLPLKRVTVATFEVGRFPVTVWEYGKYLTDAIQDPPLQWDEQQSHPGRPVTNVSWHDARSYCEWADRKWNIRCTLPTEKQWEFAARGPESRTYPWGPEEPDEYLANFGRKVGEPSPVGMFPDGSTPQGVADMAGNIWEWVDAWYDNKKEVRVLRGGSLIQLCYLPPRGHPLLGSAWRQER